MWGRCTNVMMGVPTKSEPSRDLTAVDEAWTALLESSSLSTSPPLTSVLACVAELRDNGRPALLSLLKRSGVVSLSHRQKMASALGKACRPDSLHTAADAGDAQALRAALAVMPGGENIDVLSGAGNVTPLMAAVSGGHVESAEVLLAAGAAVNVMRNMRLNALTIAAIRGHPSCCALLVSSSAALEDSDEDGWTSLMYAAVHGHEACVRILLQAGATVTHAKPNGLTVLMAAAIGGSCSCVEAIVEARAAIDAVSARGWHAVQYAQSFHGTNLGLSPVEDNAAVPMVHAPVDVCDEREGGTPLCDHLLRFRPRVVGHTHDESWRERPEAHLEAGLAASYWCGSRFSHDTNVLQVILRAHGVHRCVSIDNDDWTLCWLSGQPLEPSILARLRPHQRVNKFRHSRRVLTQKTALWATYQRMQQLHGEHGAFDFMPPTFLLPTERDALETWWLHDEPAKQTSPGVGTVGSAARNMCIYKPADASCGAGITIFDAASGAARVPPAVSAQRGVISAYIDPPYLVDGLKFDLRLYVLVTSFSPLTVYTHASGIVRFATEDYNEHASDLACHRAHVCNYAVNKNSERFVRSTGSDAERGGQGGSIWSLDAFKARLAADLGEERAARVWADVDRLIMLTLIAAAPEMRSAASEADGGRGAGGCGKDDAADGDVDLTAAQDACCFQLYGFDVMLDADARPWLLEVNGDPGLRTESPIFLQINAPMVADLLNLIGLSAKSSTARSIVADGGAQGLRDEAAARHDGVEARCGAWRRLHPSLRSQEWNAYIDA